MCFFKLTRNDIQLKNNTLRAIHIAETVKYQKEKKYLFQAPLETAKTVFAKPYKKKKGI